MKKYLGLVIFLIVLPIFCWAVERVDINSASLDQLITLTRIGPAYAQRIVDGRPYSSVDDLLRVKGIGTATLQKIKDQGLACVNCQSAQVDQSSQTSQTVTPPPAPPPTPTPQPPAETLTPVAPPIIYPSGIFINELLPKPTGPDETDEWIEIYNSNAQEVDLKNWKLRDTIGTVTTYIFPQSIIPPHGYLVLKRPITNITLNDNEDGLQLLQPDEVLVQSVKYTTAPQNQSYNRTSEDFVWSTTLTPGSANTITTYAPKQKTSTLPKPKKSANNTSVATASLSEPINQMITADNQPQNIFTNPFYLFCMISGIMILGGVGIAFWKLKKRPTESNKPY